MPQRIAEVDGRHIVVFLDETQDIASAARALRTLEIAGLLDNPARGRWQVDDPLLRAYIARLPGR